MPMSKRKVTDAMSSTETWAPPLLVAIEGMKQDLTCPRCNGLLEKSALLPCNHIVCSACIIYSTEKTCVCPSCHWVFLNEGVKPAKHIDEIVNLYKKVEAAIPANPHGKSVIRASDKEERHRCPDSDGGIPAHGADSVLSQRSKLLTTVSRHSEKPSNDKAKEPSSQLAGAKQSKKLKGHLKTQPVPKTRYLFGDECSFCHSFRWTEASGPMMCYIDGKLLPLNTATKSDSVFVHQKCAVWAPRVYMEGETLINLEAEIQRASMLKCNKCGLSGAALGCYFGNCRKSFHVPCAAAIPECRWDFDNLCLLCPSHTSKQLPCDAIVPQKQMKEGESVQTIKSPSCLGNLTVKGQSSKAQIAFLGSDLAGPNKKPGFQELLHDFVSLTGVAIVKKWADDVTHVIVATDEDGACKRTHEVLMAILTGKWILEARWIEACLDAGKLVPEELYEVCRDECGFIDRPKTGRQRAITKARKLFAGIWFCFSEHFASSYKKNLEELAVAAGGMVLKVESCLSSPQSDSMKPAMYFVYNESPPSEPTANMKVMTERCSEAKEIVLKTGARYIGHISFLDAIVDSNVQHLIT